MSGEVLDAWGGLWRAEETRQSPYSFDVHLGRPLAGGRGGKKVIVTPSIHAHFEMRRAEPSTLADLPIGLTAIKRIRRLLGHNWLIENAAWWDNRLADLIRLTADEFAARHDVKPHTAAMARLRLLGPTQRPAGWWQAPDVIEMVLSNLPTAAIADGLDLSASSVRRLRSAMQKGITA